MIDDSRKIIFSVTLDKDDFQVLDISQHPDRRHGKERCNMQPCQKSKPVYNICYLLCYIESHSSHIIILNINLC